MPKRSRYQEKIIKNYYKNRDAIAIQRVQEIITELYLSEGKKREKQWQNLATHLAKLGVEQSRIDRLIEKNDPALVASTVQKLLAS